ncbi:MAG TPA: DUF255 domain-containing protein [Candidatus Didemnitutus sp.]|jgi:hypothetical protein
MNFLRIPGLAAFLAAASAFAADDGLAGSVSDLLHSQAAGAVHWQAWDASIVERAKASGKPVYVFAGSQLNELTRATCRQTFANAEVASFLNANFFCVIVDRDEQPGLAAAIQYFLKSVKQQDGWPAHLWLTPELQPYEGAAYLPPSEEWGKPSFMKVARQAAEAWSGDAKACRARAADAVALMKSEPDLPLPVEGAPPKLEAQVADAIAAWRATADAASGGFGTAPKALEPELLQVLLARGPADHDLAVAALHAIVNGAARDPLDGGFFARTTDAAWKVPYFQKSLADQARIVLALLDAAHGGSDPAFASAARGALDYTLSRLALPSGGLAAAEDATGDESSGYYTWTEAEIDSVLGPDSAAFKKAYAIATAGNISADDDPSAHFKGRNVLRRATPAGSAGEEAALAASARKLLTTRLQRPLPPRRERATAAAQGLALAAFSRAAGELPEPRFAAAAAKLYAALRRDYLTGASDLRHLAAPSVAGGPADYAAVAFGCRAFAHLGKHPEAAALADRLVARADALFLDGAHGRYLATAASLAPGIFVRAPATGDVPSAECLAVMAGLPADTKAGVVRTLAASLEAGTAPPGDALLALTR